MNSITYDIVHFEDEPNTVSWVPEYIFIELCKKFKELEQLEEEYRIETTNDIKKWIISLPERGMSIRYWSCETSEQFTQALKLIKNLDNLLVIFDLMEQREKKLECSGIDRYRELIHKDRRLKSKCFFLTGYADQIPREIADSVGNEHICSKPVIADEFTRKIITSLNILQTL